MASKSITLTAEEMEQRIATACRSLSRKKFTEKQLKQFIVNGKVPNETKRTKSGYQLFLDDFRKELSKEERAQVGQVAKDGAAAWKELDEDEKQPYLDKAAELKEAALAANPKPKKTPKAKKAKSKKTEDSDEEDDVDEEEKPKTKKTPKAKKTKAKHKKTDDSDEEDEPEVEEKPKKKTPKAKKAGAKAKKTDDSDEEDEPKKKAQKGKKKSKK